MREVITYLYKFDELAERAKARAIEDFRVHNLEDYDWSEGVKDEAKHIGSLMGIEIDNVYFSGFYSQGDGACFTGTYAFKNNSVGNVTQYAPRSDDLHAIAEELYNMQEMHHFKIVSRVSHRGRYYYAASTVIETEGLKHAFSDPVAHILRRFMDWIYRELKQEYEYLQSDGSITEILIANGYEFDKDGFLKT
jgi:hypothetical protein